MKKTVLAVAFAVSALGFASTTLAVTDGSDIPQCKGVTDVCQNAQVTAVNKKSNKTITGYQNGEHTLDGHGLWADCVAMLAQHKPVAGVTGVSAQAAQGCMTAQRAAHPPVKH